MNNFAAFSSQTVTPQKAIGDNLNYNFDYVYDENYAHRLINAGERYYKYDANGNITVEQDGSFESNGEDVSYHKITQEADDVYSTDYGWGLFAEDNANAGSSGVSAQRYKRTYTWNERNQLVSSVDSNYSTAYIYGQDGQRSNKYTASSETLYFNKMWTLHTDSGNALYGGQYAKNIYLGETRIVTKLNSGNNPTYQEEYYKQYYYHSDHLGSASLISDYKGDEYQRIEYTPYGETWVEKTSNTGLEYLPYKFTGKEIDEETGLYYYGARYLDPKYSRWISTDPALGEYIPQASIDEEAKRYNQNLPGMGGVFNSVNLQLYHYAGNNPIRYVDPDGNDIRESTITSKSIAVLGAGRGSIGIAKDSNDELAIFIKLEAGIGFGGEIYKFGDVLKIYDAITNFVSDIKDDYEAIDNFMSIPEDTGKENFSDLPNLFGIISFKHEDYSSWDGHLPSEASFLIGASGDKEGNVELTTGLSVIAATYLTEETMYINISNIIER